MTEHGTCPKCGTALVLAVSIDTYCPNTSCTYERDQMRATILRVRQERLDLLNDAYEWADDLALSGTAADNARYNILMGVIKLAGGERPPHPSWDTESYS